MTKRSETIIRDTFRYNDKKYRRLTRRLPRASTKATFLCETLKDTSAVPAGSRIYLHDYGYEVSVMLDAEDFDPHLVALELDAINYYV